jgi:hypothetical protein
VVRVTAHSTEVPGSKHVTRDHLDDDDVDDDDDDDDDDDNNNNIVYFQNMTPGKQNTLYEKKRI